MTTQIDLLPGQVAVILTPGPDDTFGAEAKWNFTGLDADDGDTVADCFFFKMLALGLASLSIDSTDLVYEAGETIMAAQIKADAV